jgi:hypothetical protein
MSHVIGRGRTSKTSDPEQIGLLPRALPLTPARSRDQLDTEMGVAPGTATRGRMYIRAPLVEGKSGAHVDQAPTDQSTRRNGHLFSVRLFSRERCDHFSAISVKIVLKSLIQRFPSKSFQNSIKLC